MAKVRREAVELVRRWWSTRKVSRHFGFSHSAVVKWCAKAKKRGYGAIPTKRSKPKTSPNALPREIVSEIVRERTSKGRCAEHVLRSLTCTAGWCMPRWWRSIVAEPSVQFIRRARRKSPFFFEMIQADHGPEFSTWFTHSMWRIGIKHRHARVRQSNDNAHVERFNRTLQEEYLDKTTHTILSFKKVLPEHLKYYNTERTHMGINYQISIQLVPRS